MFRFSIYLFICFCCSNKDNIVEKRHLKPVRVSGLGVCCREADLVLLGSLISVGTAVAVIFFFSSPAVSNWALESFCMGARASICLGMFQVIKK